jgi:formylglycine-generating enzyme required for sulfatase activity
MLALQAGIPRRVRELALASVGVGSASLGEARADFPAMGGYPITRAHFGLPLLEWINIPAGNLNLHTVVGEFIVQPFAISRYPVTQEQFRAFIDDAGYSNSQWWDGLIYPRDVQVPDTHTPDLPMVNLSWYEAMAYTRWLSYHTGLDIMLPSESQWQWAAHGEARTLYPWGDIFDLSRCNIKESGFGGLTSVTRFEDGTSPFGVQDMSGNVWEWTRTEYDSPDKDASLNITSPALRGGSFEERMKHARTTSRARYYPHLFRHDLGFRIASRTWVSE